MGGRLPAGLQRLAHVPVLRRSSFAVVDHGGVPSCVRVGAVRLIPRSNEVSAKFEIRPPSIVGATAGGPAVAGRGWEWD